VEGLISSHNRRIGCDIEGTNMREDENLRCFLVPVSTTRKHIAYVGGLVLEAREPSTQNHGLY
jgi:hypothetical protein